MSEKQMPTVSWKPPEHFIKIDSRVPGVIVYAPKPPETDKEEVKSYTCPNCGANIAYDVSAGGVACEYCGYVAPIRAINVGKSADEFEFYVRNSLTSQNRVGA